MTLETEILSTSRKCSSQIARLFREPYLVWVVYWVSIKSAVNRQEGVIITWLNIRNRVRTSLKCPNPDSKWTNICRLDRAIRINLPGDYLQNSIPIWVIQKRFTASDTKDSLAHRSRTKFYNTLTLIHPWTLNVKERCYKVHLPHSSSSKPLIDLSPTQETTFIKRSPDLHRKWNPSTSICQTD